MKRAYWMFLAAGLFLQLFGRHLGIKGTEFPVGLTHFHVMIAGVVLFTLGSIQYTRAKGRMWAWGLFGIILPFFLIVVLIPAKNKQG